MVDCNKVSVLVDAQSLENQNKKNMLLRKKKEKQTDTGYVLTMGIVTSLTSLSTQPPNSEQARYV